MPIYEIHCFNCNENSELLYKDQNSEMQCPKCESKRIKKLMSATSSITGKSSLSSISNNVSTCCGSSLNQSNCDGPGSCCGRS